MATPFDQRTEFRWHDVGIVGSGPAGLSAAAHAAELGISHVLIEAEAHVSNTIHKYQKGKHVMAEPQILPLRSPLTFAAGKREVVLDTWNREVGEQHVDIRYGCEVASIRGADNAFDVTTQGSEAFHCRKVNLDLGVQQKLRK